MEGERAVRKVTAVKGVEEAAAAASRMRARLRRGAHASEFGLVPNPNPNPIPNPNPNPVRKVTAVKGVEPVVHEPGCVGGARIRAALKPLTDRRRAGVLSG